MKLHILAEKPENGNKCYLCKATLEEYISDLPEDYHSDDIQRGIEGNVYLDNLIDTVLNKGHIPPISLVIEDYEESNNFFKIKKFKILDGLQRTYRLKIIWDTFHLFQKLQEKEDFDKISRFSLSKKYPRELYEINSSANLLYKIIEYKKNKNTDIASCFNENSQWFEVWTKLSAREQVDKMLILNAGHKPVKLRHQLELLFLNLIPYLEKTGQFELIREKDKTSYAYTRSRRPGQFHFSHIISAILSFIRSKPITANTDLLEEIQGKRFEIQGERFDNENLFRIFDYEFFEILVSFLMTLDNAANKEELSDKKHKWLGKEAVLTGIFGALGKYRLDKSVSVKELFEKVIRKLESDKNFLNLAEYYKTSTLDISKVKIGSVYRKAVSSGFYDFLENIDNENYGSIDWKEHFNKH